MADEHRLRIYQHKGHHGGEAYDPFVIEEAEVPRRLQLRLGLRSV